MGLNKENFKQQSGRNRADRNMTQVLVIRYRQANMFEREDELTATRLPPSAGTVKVAEVERWPTWQRAMKEITKRLGAVGSTRLP
ncbi:hypothetical protein T265_00361 [Opisthorchis viverrini]|uniref:Uncharacterized protein n=1 Tax=Opisthorchis viverrini TaxID=6198 RepID=A0A075A3H6_OPIVI|nr:hypothetical protein T265_00361 [Opisthorchis viverrini]KER33926.1 hypothetical protein T265_00361 [Opisthorchis viverrini]